MSEVFLGVYSDTELTDELAEDMTVSRAGGPPYVIKDTWLYEHYPQCGLCGKEMVFVVQLFSDYDPTTYRFLHVFVCPSTSCSNESKGWRCFRTMRPVIDIKGTKASRPVTTEKFSFMDKSSKQQHPESDAFDLSDLASALNDVELSDECLFGASNETTKDGIRDAVGVERVCNVAGVAVHPKGNDAIELTPAYQLYVVPEPAEWEGALTREKELYQAYLDSGNPDPSLSASVKESHGAVIADDDFAGIEEDEKNKNFIKFQERISRLPGQVLRYNYCGSPLWAGKFAAEKSRPIPVCGSCGAPRVFECQLLSSLFYLSGWFDGHENDMDWGIAAMYTCSEDCHGTGGLSYNASASMYEEYIVLEPSTDMDGNSPSKASKKP